MSSQELLGRKAADPVLAANKQQLLQLGHARIAVPYRQEVEVQA
jgi:hypothetical protein